MRAENQDGIGETESPVYVIGHRNPDTDSVVSAIGYAWLLRERDKIDARAVRAGVSPAAHVT